ncbi:hypothetical protein TNCV_1173021 [Trichonephila clavipes]|uniref:Uncharacterized protein n=1 Tax=Trichonephila clavipes TaxID=2585209 RepID=A0A8X6RYA1_TRICX|nr:hypothetical protein TNCV_1173021 [Trichonephila clavipes]
MGYLVASGIEPRPSGLESDALTTRLPTAPTSEEVLDGGPRNYQPPSSDENAPSLNPTLSKLPNNANGRSLSLDHSIMCVSRSTGQVLKDYRIP